MNRFWNFTRNEEGGCTLEIFHEIAKEDSWWRNVSSSNAFRSELNECSGPLRVLINSPGGDVFAGADMYTALRQYARTHGRVTCLVTGLAGSAASMVAMAGDEVLISPVGTIMIHNPWTGLYGNADELREMADVLDTLRDGMVYSYVQKTGKDNDEIIEMMASETWMNASQAVEEGFADGLMELHEPDAGAQASGWRYAAAACVKGICAAVKEDGQNGAIAQMREAAQRIAQEMELPRRQDKTDNRARTALRLKMACL